jgi:predicted secreted protein
MAFIHSRVSAFTLNSVALTAFVDSVSVSQSIDASETTTIGIDAKTYIVGLEDATISVSGKYDDTTSTGPEAAITAAIAGQVPVSFSYEPEDGESSYGGNCVVTSYEVSSPVGDVVAFSLELQVTGGMTVS